MAKLILGDKHKTHSPRLLRLLWALEAGIVGLLGAIGRLLPADTASRIAARLARRIGPRLDKTRLIRRNLKLAFPEKTPAELDQLVRGIWGKLGSIVSEYPHLPTICGSQADQRLEIVMPDVAGLRPRRKTRRLCNRTSRQLGNGAGALRTWAYR